MGRLIKKGEFTSTWPPFLGLTKEQIASRIEELTNDGYTLEDAFATVLYENNETAANQLKEHMLANLQFLDDKIKSLIP